MTKRLKRQWFMKPFETLEFRYLVLFGIWFLEFLNLEAIC